MASRNALLLRGMGIVLGMQLSIAKARSPRLPATGRIFPPAPHPLPRGLLVLQDGGSAAVSPSRRRPPLLLCVDQEWRKTAAAFLRQHGERER